MGRNQDDPLFLQAKEARASVLEHFAGQSQYRHNGQRVVAGQRARRAAAIWSLAWWTAPAWPRTLAVSPARHRSLKLSSLAGGKDRPRR
ncbi:MAG: DUF2252 family protein [Streptosporangiaceae bacterium]